MARHSAERSHHQMRQREVRVLKREAAVPCRPPKHVTRVSRDLFGDGDEGSFDRTQAVRVFKREELARDEDIDAKNDQQIQKRAE